MGAVVDTSGQFCLFLFPQNVQQGRRFKFHTLGQNVSAGIFLCLADQECTLYPTGGTVITNRTFRNTVFYGELANRDKSIAIGKVNDKIRYKHKDFC